MSEKNYKMIICYDGTRYFGWEHQPDKETIQGKLEAVLSRMCDKGVDVTGAGRTDAGVHARAMCASVKMDTPLSPEEIKDYMNRYLPDDIAVREVRIASDQFHARYKAIGKTYRYTCYIGDSKPVFDRKYMAVLDFKPDIEAMEKACGFLTGKHDYKSFCGNSHMKKSTVRIVDSIVINVKKDTLTITFHGTGFLQNMVRIMVGTLLEVGRGRYAPEHVKEILEACDRTQAGPTAPACGLCLICVDYM
jgi:tRNA pseudouridine38-40 synthase